MRRGWLAVVGIVAGGALLSCCGLGVVSYVFYAHEVEQPLEEADRSLVITAEDIVARAPEMKADPERGRLRKVRFLDGSRELSYEYESPDEAESTLYLSYIAGVEPTANDAHLVYISEGASFKLGLQIGAEGDMKLVDRNELWRWGDESRCAVITNDGHAVGNLFMGRQGRRRFTLVIIGVYFDDDAAIADLLEPMLRELESYSG
jgi:hypothetical protein